MIYFNSNTNSNRFFKNLRVSSKEMSCWPAKPLEDQLSNIESDEICSAFTKKTTQNEILHFLLVELTN